MTKTLDEILKNERVLVDTNILLSKFYSDKNESSTLDELPYLNQYLTRILQFAQNQNTQISKGVYSEYRLIYNQKIGPTINSIFFKPNLSISTRQELSKLKSNYRRIKQAFMFKKINPIDLKNRKLLISQINSFGENYSQQKPISEIDIELFTTACHTNSPIITNDSDFRTIYNWFKNEFRTQYSLPITYMLVDFDDKTIQRRYVKLK